MSVTTNESSQDQPKTISPDLEKSSNSFGRVNIQPDIDPKNQELD